MHTYIRSIAALVCLSCMTAAAYEPDKDNMEAIEIPNTAEAEKLASVCLTRMYAAMAQPNSGRVKVSFTVGDEPPYLYSIAFDKAWKLFRCEAEALPEESKSPSTPRTPKPEIWIRNEECQMIQLRGWHAISKYAKDVEMHSIDPLPFDPRLLGIATSWIEFQRFDYTLEQYKKLISEKGYKAYAVESSDGGFRIVYEMGSPNQARWFVGLDPKFHPFKSEMWPWIESKKTWWHQGTAIVRRESFDGVDVPIEADMFDNDGKLKAVVHCDWQEVNVPIDPTTFELASLKVEGRTIVVDHRSGEPVIEKVIGTE